MAETPGLSEAAAEVIGQPTDLAALERLRRRLTEALVAEGFVSSGVRLAEIDLDAGVATYEIVAGTVTGVSVEGVPDEREAGEIDADYVVGRLNLEDGLFNLETTEERLRLLLRDRAIERVDAAVRPGASPGDTQIDLTVGARRAYDLSATIANDTPDGLGETTFRLNGAYRNFFTAGDEIRAQLEASEGRRSLIIEGDAPIHPGGPAPFLAFEVSDSSFVKGPLDPLDVQNQFVRLGGGLRVPVLETSRQTLTAVAGFDWKRTSSSLLGLPLSFSAGVDNGVAKTAVASLALEYVDLAEDRTIAFRGAANFGLPLLGATENAGSLPDGQFITLLAQAQVAQRLVEGWTLIARAQGQWANDPLLPLEQVAIGGSETVRGFGEAIVAGDDALVGGLEARIDLGDAAMEGLTPPGAAAPVTLAPFVEGGTVWRKNGRGSDTLASVGAGLLWSPAPGVEASLFAGARVHGPDGGGGLQGEGVHFAVTMALP